MRWLHSDEPLRRAFWGARLRSLRNGVHESGDGRRWPGDGRAPWGAGSRAPALPCRAVRGATDTARHRRPLEICRMARDPPVRTTDAGSTRKGGAPCSSTQPGPPEPTQASTLSPTLSHRPATAHVPGLTGTNSNPTARRRRDAWGEAQGPARSKPETSRCRPRPAVRTGGPCAQRPQRPPKERRG